MKTCPVCEGKKVVGKIARGEDAETAMILGRKIPVFTILDQPCASCGGTGLVPDDTAKNRSETYTREPWQYSTRDWRGEEHPHHFFVRGDPGEGTTTAVAIVVGTATSGDIPRATARRICAAVNATAVIPVAALESGVVADLLAACKSALLWLLHEGYPADNAQVMRCRAALANVKEGCILAKAEDAIARAKGD